MALTSLLCAGVFLALLAPDQFRARADVHLLQDGAQINRKADTTGPKITPAAKKKVAWIELKLKEALRRAPDSFEPNHNLGEFYIKQGKLAAAIPHLEKAQQINPSHYVNSYDLALAYFQVGNLSQAHQQIQRTLACNDTAELHNLLGTVEDQAGNLVAAAEEYQRAFQMEGSEKHLFDFGNSLLKLHSYDEAEKVFRYGLDKNSRSAKLLIGLGIAQYSRGQFEQAVKTLCEAADLEPSDHRPYLFLGEMYGVSAEMAEEVTKRLAHFVQLHPRNALAHYYYALNLWKGGHGLDHDRDVDQPKYRAGHQGLRSDQQIDLDRIEALLKIAIALDPRFSQAHYQLGVLYFDQRKLSEAIREFRRAIRLQPDLAQAHYRLGQVYERTGQKSLAAQEIDIFKRLKDQESRQLKVQ